MLSLTRGETEKDINKSIKGEGSNCRGTDLCFPFICGSRGRLQRVGKRFLLLIVQFKLHDFQNTTHLPVITWG